MRQPMPAPRLPAALQQHAGLIHKIASGYCRDANDRDEVVQEIAVQLWRAQPRYDPRFAETTWIYRIALNVAISWFRRERRYRRGQEPLDAEQVLSPSLPEPSDQVQALLRAIDTLDAFDRGLVLLHLDDLDHQAIAAVLGISASNVGTRLMRLRQRLRRVLSPPTTNLPGANDDGTR